MNFNNSLMQKLAVNEIIKCNEFTTKHFLVLTIAQATELLETSTYSLKENKRVEFGSGLIEKIIKEFCDSPYISMENYAETLHELIEIFYYYKNETLDLISDDDLIKFMHKAFDGICQGSLELLYGRELEKTAHNLRYGHAYDYSEEDNSKEEEGDEYGTD
jgi:hypothetical protein